MSAPGFPASPDLDLLGHIRSDAERLLAEPSDLTTRRAALILMAQRARQVLQHTPDLEPADTAAPPAQHGETVCAQAPARRGPPGQIRQCIRVFTSPIPKQGRFMFLNLPPLAEVFQVQAIGADSMKLWAVCPLGDHHDVTFAFLVLQTGAEFHREDQGRYIGSSDAGGTVWHVWEARR